MDGGRGHMDSEVSNFLFILIFPPFVTILNSNKERRRAVIIISLYYYYLETPAQNVIFGGCAHFFQPFCDYF